MLTVAISTKHIAEEAALERHFGLEPIQPPAMFDPVSDCRSPAERTGTMFLFPAPSRHGRLSRHPADQGIGLSLKHLHPTSQG